MFISWAKRNNQKWLVIFRGTLSEEPWDRVFIGIVEWGLRPNATYLWIYNSMQNIPQLYHSGFGKKNGTTKNDIYIYMGFNRKLNILNFEDGYNAVFFAFEPEIIGQGIWKRWQMVEEEKERKPWKLWGGTSTYRMD